MPTQKSPARAIAAGLISGIAATLVMDQFLKLASTTQKAVDKKKKLAQGESPWEIAHEQVLEEQQSGQQENSTVLVARKIAETTGQFLPADKKEAAGNAVHYTFGTLMGVLYSVTAELLPEATTGGGTAFGTLLFLGADEIAVPAFRLAPPPTETPAEAHLEHWAAHVVYGGSLELFRRLVRRLL